MPGLLQQLLIFECIVRVKNVIRSWFLCIVLSKMYIYYFVLLHFRQLNALSDNIFILYSFVWIWEENDISSLGNSFVSKTVKAVKSKNRKPSYLIYFIPVSWTRANYRTSMALKHYTVTNVRHWVTAQLFN